MPTDAFRGTLGRVRDALARADPGEADGRLLARFVAGRDGEAFAALVRRHGPMVFGVCRRVVGDHQLAEDAFQATFLVLARRAAAVRPASAVGPFLYGVAVRTSLEARAVHRRRAARERTGAALPEPAVADAPPCDLRAVLDEEVGRLPAKYRAALVACDLDGQSRRDAAARLGLVEGTLSSRLTTARTMLADRLRKRGVALTLPALAAAGRAADAVVPPGWLESAARIGTAGGVGTVPAAAAALASRVIRAMTYTNLKLAAAGVLAVAAGALAWAAAPPSAAPAPPPPAATKAAANKPAGPNRLMVYTQQGILLIDPDAGPGAAGERAVTGEGYYAGALSPDGTRAAVVDYPSAVPPGHVRGPRVTVRRLDRTADDLVVPPPEPGAMFLSGAGPWSPDGERVVVTVRLAKKPGEAGPSERSYAFHPATGTFDLLPLPETNGIAAGVLDWSADGKTLLITALAPVPGQADRFTTHLALLPAAGGKPDLLTPDALTPGQARLSPDGTRVVFTARGNGAGAPDQGDHVYVMGLADRKPVRVSDADRGAGGIGCCWSPDGARVAYVRLKTFSTDGTVDGCNFAVVVANPDGSDSRTVATRSTTGHSAAKRFIALLICDWR